MELNQKQKYVKALIEKVSDAVDLSPIWPLAIAMTESSLGLNQKSGTGARGVFQMTSIAMKDLLLEMEKQNDDVIDVLCGIAFLYLLMKRWGTFHEATKRFCDPADRDFYWKRVKSYMEEFLTQESQ
jgi:membrane-bound lytic murein transglycosylase MltF